MSSVAGDSTLVACICSANMFSSSETVRLASFLSPFTGQISMVSWLQGRQPTFVAGVGARRSRKNSTGYL
jgi:hypothetical protein